MMVVAAEAEDICLDCIFSGVPVGQEDTENLAVEMVR